MVLANEFLNIINSPLCKTKSVTRYSGSAQNKIETLSDHILDVSMMSYYIARNLIQLGVEVDIGVLLQKCLIHDLDEVLIGDIPRMTKYSSPECHKLLHDLACKTAKELSHDIDGTDYTYDIWLADKDDSIEGSILRLTDMLSVANKVIYEVEFLGNIGFLKIAVEINQYLSDVRTKVEGALGNNQLALQYINKIIEDAREVMDNMIDHYDSKIKKYNLYDEFTRKIVERRDKE